MYIEFAKIYNKYEYSILEIVKKEKETHASFAVVPQTEEVMATECHTCSLRGKKH